MSGNLRRRRRRWRARIGLRMEGLYLGSLRRRRRMCCRLVLCRLTSRFRVLLRLVLAIGGFEEFDSSYLVYGRRGGWCRGDGGV